LRDLEATLNHAQRLKLVGIEFSARWAQLEAQRLAGNRSSANSTRDQLKKDATGAGFLLIARKAAKE